MARTRRQRRWRYRGFRDVALSRHPRSPSAPSTRAAGLLGPMYLGAAAVVLVATACSVPVAADLGENDANRVVVALERSNLLANKEPDPDHENRWRVTVLRDEASTAARVLEQNDLPPSETTGVLDALGDGAMIPSRTSEHARLVVGTAGELERSLREVDGMLSARVHLAIPSRGVLDLEGSPTPATASVLVRHRGERPPLSRQDIQRLVAGAVPGLAPAQVSVVTAAVPQSPPAPEQALMRVGPIAVARSSLGSVRLVVGAIAVLGLVLVGVLVAGWLRLRRALLLLEEARAATPAPEPPP